MVVLKYYLPYTKLFGPRRPVWTYVNCEHGYKSNGNGLIAYHYDGERETRSRKANHKDVAVHEGASVYGFCVIWERPESWEEWGRYEAGLSDAFFI